MTANSLNETSALQSDSSQEDCLQASISRPFAAAVSRIVFRRLHTRPICSSHCCRPSASVSKRSRPSTWSMEPCRHTQDYFVIVLGTNSVGEGDMGV